MSMFFHGMAWGIVITLLAKPFLEAACLVVKNAWANAQAKPPEDDPPNEDAATG